jgi:hypothetical protein
MEEEILKQITEQGKKIDEIYRSVEKTRKYFLWTMIITVALFVLPLIGLMIAIPTVMSTYGSALNGL